MGDLKNACDVKWVIFLGRDGGIEISLIKQRIYFKYNKVGLIIIYIYTKYIFS